MEDFSEEPPTDINPYEVLEIETSASPSDVKTAYKRLALRHHPDKVHPSARNTAHTKFQAIAFAYAIVSDPRRRARYDNTGSTSESLDVSDGDFDWREFYRAQWADAVTGETLNTFKDSYQNSEEEEGDVLKAYETSGGKMKEVFRKVMLCNEVDDEERFRGYIDKAIEKGKVEAYDAYVNETKKSRDNRHKKAKKSAVEAEEHAKTLGVYESLFGDGGGNGKQDKKNGKKDGEAGLADLIQQRSKGRAATFLEDLEAKYAPVKKGTVNGSKGKKRGVEDGPSEEAFQKTAARQKKQKRPVVEEDEEDEEMEDDLEDDSEPESVSIPTVKKPAPKVQRGKKNKNKTALQEEVSKVSSALRTSSRTKQKAPSPALDEPNAIDVSLNLPKPNTKPATKPKPTPAAKTKGRKPGRAKGTKH